ncbi:MAG TPA: hypothetical protein VGF76_12580, partial [Polyangiaceae bacterium]
MRNRYVYASLAIAIARLEQWLPISVLLFMGCSPAPVMSSGTGGAAGTTIGSSGSSGSPVGTGGGVGGSGAVTGGTSGSGGSAGAEIGGSGSGAGGSGGGSFTCPTLTVPGSCAPPVDIRCPYTKLSQTGCID